MPPVVPPPSTRLKSANRENRRFPFLHVRAGSTEGRAASGIGLAMVGHLAKEGMKVVMANIEQAALEPESKGLGSDSASEDLRPV